MPTLLEKGKIIKQKWMDRGIKNKIDEMIGIEFLMEYIKDRSWLDRSTPPKERLRGLGSKVLVLRSGTGSGKSTLLPPFLYKEFLLQGGNLIITQPTKATTTDIPYQIVQYNKFLKMGVNIGFQTGSVAWKPLKGILFSTYGILLQHLKIMEDEQFMKRYRFIIIDEVHSRTVEIDNCLFYLKRMLNKYWDQPECPFVILTSATFDPKIFMDYFHCPKNHFLDVAGATFPRYVEYAPFDLSDYVSYCIDRTEKIHVDNIDDVRSNNTFRDILIFVQGGKQIRDITNALHKLNTEVFDKGLDEAKAHSVEQWKKYTGGKSKAKLEKFYIAPIAASSNNIQAGGREYRDLFSDIATVTVDIYEFDADGNITDKVLKTVPASRRVIIGTNAIETGMTIDTLGYCIDTGFVNQSSFNPNFGCQMLLEKNVTQSSSEQRKGRVGRKASGWFYPAYTEKILNYMDPLPFPDIVKEDITQFILGVILGETETTIKQVDYTERDDDCFQMNQFDQNWYKLENKNVFSASMLDFIQYPSADSMGFSIEKLHGLGLIDHEYNPTLFGYYANKFRKLNIENICMILAGYYNQAYVLDLVTIACCLQLGFDLKINKRKYIPRNPLNVSSTESYYYYRLLFSDEFIEYLFIWNDFMEVIGKVGSQLEKSSRKSKKKELPVGYIEKWTRENFFSLEGFLNIIELRDEVIGDMLAMGLNPYYNGLNLSRGGYNLVNILNHNLQEGMDEIRKIKMCIYEGYRFNLCTWESGVNGYVNQHYHTVINIDSKILRPLGNEIKDDEDIKQRRPKYIITSDIRLRPSFITKGMYEFAGSDISVMDGFVEIDASFLHH